MEELKLTANTHIGTGPITKKRPALMHNCHHSGRRWGSKGRRKKDRLIDVNGQE